MPSERPALAYELSRIGEYLGGRKDRTLKFLEVGCGTRSPAGARLRDLDYQFRLHGLDIDRYAADNQFVDEVVIADATQMPFKEEAYDVLVSHYMLEHLKDCRESLREMSRVVAKDGLLAMVFPNPAAPDSITTRYTPYWFHVLFRRFIQRRADAARSSFPTFFSFRSVDNVVRWLEENGFSSVKAEFFPETYYRFRTWRLVGRVMIFYCNMLTRLGLKRFMSSVVVIAQK